MISLCVYILNETREGATDMGDFPLKGSKFQVTCRKRKGWEECGTNKIK